MTASPVVRKGKLLCGRNDKNISNLTVFNDDFWFCIYCCPDTFLRLSVGLQHSICTVGQMMTYSFVSVAAQTTFHISHWVCNISNCTIISLQTE